MNIADLLDAPPMARSELVQRAGISRNTEWSIRHDQSRARLDTLREIALACGYDVDVVLHRVYDPVAVAAARVLVGDLELDELLAADADLLGSQPAWTAMDEWRERLRRYASADPAIPTRTAGAVESLAEPSPLTLAIEAAQFAGAQHVPMAIMLAGRSDLARLMSAAVATADLFRTTADADERFGHKWAFSGWPALEGLGAEPRRDVVLGPEPSRRQSALPTIVWTTLPTQFAQFLGGTHRRVGTVRAASVVVAPLTAVQLVGRGELEGAPLVSPVQSVIDSLGVGGDLAAAALDLATGW